MKGRDVPNREAREAHSLEGHLSSDPHKASLLLAHGRQHLSERQHAQDWQGFLDVATWWLHSRAVHRTMWYSCLGWAPNTPSPDHQVFLTAETHGTCQKALLLTAGGHFNSGASEDVWNMQESRY